NKNVIKWLLVLLLFEIVIGIIEYALGVPYLIKPENMLDTTSYGESDLLYYNKVFGISKSLSLFAQKVFVGVVTYVFAPFRKRFFSFLAIGILIVGLIITFNRSALGASVLFLLFVFIDKRWSKGSSGFSLIRKVSLFVVAFL